MFIANVVIGDYIIERSFFYNLIEASEYAQETVRHKVWEIGNGQFYYGNVEARIYEPKYLEASDYKDEHILSFSRPVRNSTNAM